jgi:predicted nucleic acid-binding protein
VRVVVADTSPLHYLILIEQSSVLLSLFGKISIPSVVQRELMHAEAPPLVRNWMAQLPNWVEVHEVATSHVDVSMQELDEGERAAIELAASIKADLLLMDDRKGVSLARSKGFAVTGTLGVLELAAERGLLDLSDGLSRLKNTSFHWRQEIIDALLARHKKKA